MSRSRENILGAVHNAVQIPFYEPEDGSQSAPVRNACVNLSRQELWQRFASELSRVAGEFHFCDDLAAVRSLLAALVEEEKLSAVAFCDEPLANQLQLTQKIETVLANQIPAEDKKKRLSVIPAAVSRATLAVAETGSLLIRYDQIPETMPLFLADCVIFILCQDQVVADLHQAFSAIPAQTGNMVLITGPSRTADIEKVLVLGAHGPRRLIVCCISKNV